MASTLATRTRSAYRAFDVEVAATTRLSPSFVRVTFTGDDLEEFGDTGLDQRIKVVLPRADGQDPHVADFAHEDWYQSWRARPELERNPFRTYTVRAVRRCAVAGSGKPEVDVDFVLHGTGPESGPASRWAANVRAGARSVLVGPDAGYDGPPVGLEWRPPRSAESLLLAGDETAVPAILSILESLPDGVRADAFCEVPHPGDVLDVAMPDGVALTWLPRLTKDGTHEHGEPLGRAVRAHLSARHRAAEQQAEGDGQRADPEDVDVDATILWDVPDADCAARGLSDCYAWIAGEAGAIKDLRRHLVRDLGFSRSAVAFMGYWRLGRSEV